MQDHATSGPARWAVRLLGAIILLIGVVLLIGGAWLATLGGSLYYLFAGIGLGISGLLLVLRRAAGAWLYCLVVALTVAWAFWEVGVNGWALVPRVIPPLVLLVPVLAVLPALRQTSIRPGHAWTAIAAVIVVAVAAGWAISASAPPILARAVPPPGNDTMTEPSLQDAGADWPAYGGTYSARRYSPLDQINRDNVGDLERVWLVHTGDLPQSELAQDKYGAENTPLKVGDSLFVCTPKNIIIAYDAATGEERWRYDPQVSDENIPYTAACRGVAYFEAPGADAGAACARRIIEGTLAPA
ncbi:hypothetical protein [Methylobrevis pamukkalensis]|uniref:Quinoprotein glucose dehydrogenase n=1 Tax=Methylobrevis pamukkalensis TaxID=1439726 RepID=A0A1E3H6A5_9HYPH|nr:hypothetical protein [Methylobrevis pamukkalensis]ODN71041.1 Quinoprotein glucose dehydrogenase [Methylobrevis pamukkalensis]